MTKKSSITRQEYEEGMKSIGIAIVSAYDIFVLRSKMKKLWNKRCKEIGKQGYKIAKAYMPHLFT